jgi:hypothetical protein
VIVTVLKCHTHPAGLTEDSASASEDATDNEALQSSSHAALAGCAIWRLTDGPGASPEVAAATPVANRTAAGRLDFVLQARAGACSCMRRRRVAQLSASPPGSPQRILWR